MEFIHGNAEKLKFCFLKIGKSNYERLVLLTIVTKTAGSDMPAVGAGRERERGGWGLKRYGGMEATCWAGVTNGRRNNPKPSPSIGRGQTKTTGKRPKKSY